MVRRSQFPRARPAKKPVKKAAQPKASKHVFIWSPSSDWRGLPYCETCDQPRSNPVHDLGLTDPDAKAIDNRRLGEGNPESTSDGA